MISKLLYWLTGFLKCRIIDSDGKPYLERYYLGTFFGQRFFIHRFVASDPDRGLHDHPWSWALSLILSGGYRELLRGNSGSQDYIHSVNRKPFSFNWINEKTMHRVLIDSRINQEAWTLFTHGKRTRGWGFLEYKIDDIGYIRECCYKALDMDKERAKNQNWWENPNCKTGRELRK